MSEKKPYYLTTAIAYTSGVPHIGNVYEIVLADSIARFRRQQGYDVRFQTGTDEHGQKIELRAQDRGMEPKVFVDEISGKIRNIYDTMNVSYDHFIRTTDPEHEKRVQHIFRKLYEQGDIYKGSYKGWYSISEEAFFTETQLEGKDPEHDDDFIFAQEECYFFRLSKYVDRLVKHIEAHPEFIQPESRKNEMINNFIKPGLQDLAVSRTSYQWGIPVDFDPKHVIYVWMDALINYITGLGYDPDLAQQPDLFDKYWPADVHLIGKDILRFHTIYWPIFLMALDLPLPKQVFGHPWLLVGNDKMSKSRGNVIYTDDLVKVFGVDATRYIMLYEMPFEKDGMITYESMIERINTDLANTLGNLVNRTLVMSAKYFNGLVENTGNSEALDEDLRVRASNLYARVRAKMDQLRVADAIDEILDVLHAANKYIDDTAPWILAKNQDMDRLHTVLYNLLETIRICAVNLEAFLPDTADKILTQLKTDQRTPEAPFGSLASGTQLDNHHEILFARLDMNKTLALLEENQPQAKPKVTHKEEITFDDFEKLELRTGKIIDCQLHPKADRLLVSKIDMGYDTIQIVSGIRPQYTPQMMIGKTVIVVVNLKPAVIRGMQSQGMILVGEMMEADQEVLEVINTTTLKPGSVVR